MISREELNEAKRKADEEYFKLEQEILSNGCEKQKRYFQDIPTHYRRLWLRVLYGPKSWSKAIKLKCIECSGWSLHEAKLCEASNCALYHYRPKDKRGKTKKEEDILE